MPIRVKSAMEAGKTATYVTHPSSQKLLNQNFQIVQKNKNIGGNKRIGGTFC